MCEWLLLAVNLLALCDSGYRISIEPVSTWAPYVLIAPDGAERPFATLAAAKAAGERAAALRVAAKGSK